MQIFNVLLNVFFPNTCISCGKVIDSNEYLCDYCHEKLPRIDFTKNCIRCGLPNKNCECNNRVFYFGGSIAPFYNDDSAQNAMYKFKFSRHTRNANFFSKQMSLTIKNVYSNVKFDGITYVPLTFKKYLKRGFNQSSVLAKQIAKICDLPYFDNLLYRNKNKIAQHKITGVKERFKNVEGLYGCKQKVKGNILLVDDIKTTGATLNECAKQLILNGADNVYCITGLITNNRKDK